MSVYQIIIALFCLSIFTVNCEDALLLNGAAPPTIATELPREECLFDALTEAFTTLLAFAVAGTAIQTLKRQSRNVEARKVKGKTSPSSPAASLSRPSQTCREAIRELSAVIATAAPQRPAPRPAQRRNTAETDALAAAVRSGRASELPRLLEAAWARAAAEAASGTSENQLELLAADQLQSALRACALHRCFREALVAYDHAVEHIGIASGSMWSILLYCAVNTQDFARCPMFYERLLASTSPSGNDFVNMVRYHARVGDATAFAAMLSDLRARGCTYDVFSRNRALAACTSNNALDFADALATAEGICAGMDTVGYNTLMKGHAAAGDSVRCFQFYEDMRAAGLQPSEISFGILLDACGYCKDVDRASQVCEDMRKFGFQFNVVHYTTFMKILTNAGRFNEAAELLDEMHRSPSTKPDLVAYSTLVKALADQGRVMDAIRIVEHMLKHHIVPDAIVFNLVLTGCTVKCMVPEQIRHVLKWLVHNGLQASTTTLSIAVKAFAQSRSWDAALELLDAAPAWLQLVPEARLYTQLAHACAKEGDGAAALATYASMASAAQRTGRPVDQATSSRLNRIVALCAEPSSAGPAAMRLHRSIARAGGLASAGEIDAALAESGAWN